MNSNAIIAMLKLYSVHVPLHVQVGEKPPAQTGSFDSNIRIVRFTL